jgi:hypothetical protein
MQEPNGFSPYDEALILAILIVGVFVIAAVTGCSSPYSVEFDGLIGGRPAWSCEERGLMHWSKIAQCWTPEECNKICADARKGTSQ